MNCFHWHWLNDHVLWISSVLPSSLLTAHKFRSIGRYFYFLLLTSAFFYSTESILNLLLILLQSSCFTKFILIVWLYSSFVYQFAGYFPHCPPLFSYRSFSGVFTRNLCTDLCFSPFSRCNWIACSCIFRITPKFGMWVKWSCDEK